MGKHIIISHELWCGDFFLKRCTTTDLTSQACSSPTSLPLQFDMDPLATKARPFLNQQKGKQSVAHSSYS